MIAILNGRDLDHARDEWKYLVKDGRRLAAVFKDGDANLFAAAPDMLSALKDALRRLDRLGSEHNGPCECTEAVRAAITKAEGKS